MKYYMCDVCGDTYSEMPFATHQLVYSIDADCRCVMDFDVCHKCCKEHLSCEEKAVVGNKLEAYFHNMMSDIFNRKLDGGE